ncbi:hypothetical protein OAS95_04665 [Pelagibacteraceae bacterium]|nr:hypothetical protein [Pelagibacteraceae bacterium]
MGFTDKMCYDVAKEIINDIFLVNYTPTIKENKTWYENFNNFLVTEWDRLQESEEIQSQFTEEEEHMITVDAMQILLDKLNVDEDEFEDHEQDVDWMKFDDIIGHYVCYVK